MNKYEEVYNQTVEQIKKGRRTSPLRAIRLKCLDCMCWQGNEVSLCPSDDCILWHYRFGKNKSGQRKGGKQLPNRFKSRSTPNETRGEN